MTVGRWVCYARGISLTNKMKVYGSEPLIIKPLLKILTERRSTMLRLTVRYTRYVLVTLATVGFGTTLN